MVENFISINYGSFCYLQIDWLCFVDFCAGQLLENLIPFVCESFIHASHFITALLWELSVVAIVHRKFGGSYWSKP